MFTMTTIPSGEDGYIIYWDGLYAGNVSSSEADDGLLVGLLAAFYV